MIAFDHLRPPPLLDPWPSGYKDWLHLNILHHASSSVGLVNVSLHGAPDDPRSGAIGTALVHVPGRGWVGNLEIKGYGEAAISPMSIGLARVALAIDRPPGALMASVHDPDNALTMHVRLTATAPTIRVEERLPFGRGWISWYALPRLSMVGEWTIGDERADLQTASAYHDHNWGRWHWGDDVGWEWGCFLTPAPGAAFVLSRATDRAHRTLGQPSLRVHAGNRRRTFMGAAIELRYGGALDTISRRLPGALALLHQDCAQLRLPKNIQIRANDGIDQAVVEFTARAAAQLIAGDPIQRGYGFIHEIVGEFACAGKLGDLEISGQGLGVLEYVC